jgi:hypothetical protein
VSISGISIIYLSSQYISHFIVREPTGVLWLKPNSIVEPESFRVAWGIYTKPDKAPQFWRIHIIFQANSTIWIRAYWHNASQKMYESLDVYLDETFDVEVVDVTVHNRWTWYLENPHPYPVKIENFTIEYAAIDKPTYEKGRSLLVVGGILLTTVLPFMTLLLVIFYIKNRNKRE